MATIYGGKCGPITESKVSMSFTEGDRPIYGGCSWERSDTNYGARPRDNLRRVAESYHLRSVMSRLITEHMCRSRCADEDLRRGARRITEGVPIYGPAMI